MLTEEPTTTKQMVKVVTTSPATVRSVTITWDKPGPQTLHFWRDIDSSILGYIPFRHFEFDAVPPLEIQVKPAEVGREVTYSLAQSGRILALDPLRPIFVGIFVAGERPSFSSSDSTASQNESIQETYLPTHQPRPKSELIRPKHAFAVMADVVPQSRTEASWFEDITGAAGLQGISTNAISWVDLDGDGDDDLVTSGPRVFLNSKGKFKEVTETCGLKLISAEACLFADIDNDGDMDGVLLARNRGLPAAVAINKGNAKFSAGPPVPAISSLLWCASWIDYDQDGLVDLFIGNGWDWNASMPFERDRLWKNLGQGVFRDVTDEVGIDVGDGAARFSRVSVAGDFGRQGKSSVFVGSYYLQPDRLWTFAGGRAKDTSDYQRMNSIPTPSGAPGNGHGLGAVIADIDNDGWNDLLLANLIHPDWRGYLASNESQIYLNRGDGVPFLRVPFRDRGIFFEETTADLSMADFDADGYLDLFHHSAYHTADFYKGSSKQFLDRTFSSGIRASEGSASAISDFDLDGRPDLAVNGGKSGLKLYRNITNTPRQIAIELVGKKSNRAAIGATLRVNVGSQTYTRSVAAGRGSGNQDSLVLYIPIRTDKTWQASVTWPSGRIETFAVKSGPFRHKFLEGSGAIKERLK